MVRGWWLMLVGVAACPEPPRNLPTLPPHPEVTAAATSTAQATPTATPTASATPTATPTATAMAGPPRSPPAPRRDLPQAPPGAAITRGADGRCFFIEHLMCPAGQPNCNAPYRNTEVACP